QRLLVLLMGVSGCGKSTTARLLQDRLPNCVFLEGDDFHPAANRNKMTSGQPLNDQDRAPWLAAIHAELVHRWLDADGGMSPDTIVLACSALKARYRSVLVPVDAPFAALVVYLRVDRDALSQRLSARTDHFFNPALLDSQLSALESP
ncbi:gluconate kinase 2 in gnt i system, thermoresistant, partial [Polychytrium aggregatum]|uniref:gluconate kinase 2 in gnt i system, thermoresistant n=1 Tax=Polychytrium aggregatum TaxID=110093 RepID=UPI0022FE2E28